MALNSRRVVRDPLDVLWTSVKQRCYNPKNHSYRHYGGRGISVHEPWITSRIAFITWINENLGPRPEGMSLDRIDNDGNYEPGNLRWATQSDQIRNRRGYAVSGHKGVRRKKHGWLAEIHYNKRTVYLGTFDTPEEAEAAFEGAARLLNHQRQKDIHHG